MPSGRGGLSLSAACRSRHDSARSVVVAALYDHPVGRELRVFFEDNEDNVFYTQVNAVAGLEAKAAQLPLSCWKQGRIPISTESPRVQ